CASGRRHLHPVDGQRDYFFRLRRGRAVIRFVDERHGGLLFRRRREPAGEILGEILDRARNGVRNEAAERAERTEFHRLAKLIDEREIRGGVDPGPDFVQRLHPTNRADPAGRALAAAFERTELENRACSQRSTVSSNTTTPPWPMRPPRSANAS